MRNELLSRIPRANGEEMRCPICNGTGIIVSERQPQGKPKERTCVACYGAGEVEEVKTDKPQLTIYKSWGIFISEAHENT